MLIEPAVRVWHPVPAHTHAHSPFYSYHDLLFRSESNPFKILLENFTYRVELEACHFSLTLTFRLRDV